MAEDKEILISIKVDNEQAQKSITEQSRKIDLLKKANDKLKASNKELAKQGSVTQKQRSKNNEEIAKNSLKISEANKVRKRAINTQKAEAGSLTDLRNKLATLTDSRNKDLTVGSKAFDEANKDIKKLSETIKGAEQNGDDFRRSVGKYPGTFKDAAGAMGGFGGATDGATGAFDALGKVIKLSPIGILVSLLAGMVAAFSQTEEGAKKLKIATAILSSIFKDFISLLATGGEVIVDFFENPLESLKSFGEGIQNYVLSQIDLVLSGLGTLGDAISALFSGDFDKAAELAGKGFNTLVVETNPLIQLIEKGSEVVEDYTEKVVENAEETVALTLANYDLQRSMLATEKQVVSLQGQEAILAKQSEDSTLSFKEQEEAQKELMKVQGERFALQQSVLQTQVSIIAKELSLARGRGEQTLEIEQRLTEAQKGLIENRNEQRLEEANNTQITAQRNQDIWEQELDFIIDVGEKRRTRFEEIATDEANSLAIRTEGLNAYDANLKQFLQSQKESFVEEGLSQEEFDRLLGIQDPAKLAEAITAQETLSEIEKNRLREVFIEFENAEIEKAKVHKDYQDLIVDQEADAAKAKEAIAQTEAKKKIALEKKVAQQKEGLLNAGFALAKAVASKDEKLTRAIAITQTVINTARGIMNAFASLPYPAAIAAAAGVAITGATQLVNIKNAGSGGGGDIGGISGPTTPSTTEPQADTSGADAAGAQQAALADAISNLGLSISVTEINEAQSNVQVSEDNSTIGN